MTLAKPLTDSFIITAVPPFRLDLTVWALRRRALNRIDRWDGFSYKRSILAGPSPLEVTVTQEGSPESGRLHVQVFGAPSSRYSRATIKRAVHRLLGLDRDLTPFYDIADKDPRLSLLYRTRFLGHKTRLSGDPEIGLVPGGSGC